MAVMGERVDLGWARAKLVDAELAQTTQLRQQACLLAARHTGYALLAAGRRVPPITEATELWGRLAAELPSFAEWASYFMLLEGRARLSERQADDLLRDVVTFCDLVDRRVSRPARNRANHG